MHQHLKILTCAHCGNSHRKRKIQPYCSISCRLAAKALQAAKMREEAGVDGLHIPTL